MKTWNKSFPRPSHRRLWHKLIQDLCLFLRYFLHIREPFLSPYIWGKGKSSNEWKLSGTYTSRTYQGTLTHPLLSNHRNIPFRIKSELYNCLQSPTWSGPWTPLLSSYTTVACWIFLQYSKSIPILEPLYFLDPLPRILCPLTFPWLVSAHMPPSSPVTYQYLKLSNSFICILVSFSH